MAKRIVLIVDDEESIRLICEMALQQMGFETLSAENGLDALRAIRSRPVDLVLSDVFMPKMTGFQLIEAMKKDPGSESIPVIFLTAATDNEHIMEGLQRGADDYISKPIRIQELLARVQMVLSKADARKNVSPPNAKHGEMARAETRPSGSIQDKHLTEIVAFCELNSLTGTLNVKYRDLSGKLIYRRGELLEVRLGAKSGDSALDEMLEWEEGTFEIIQELITNESIAKSVKPRTKDTEKPREQSAASISADPSKIDSPINPQAVIEFLESLATYSAKSLGEAKVGNFFRRSQLRYVSQSPSLGYFLVGQMGGISLIKPVILGRNDLESCAGWAREFIGLCSEKDPAFRHADMRQMTAPGISSQTMNYLDKVGFFDLF